MVGVLRLWNNWEVQILVVVSFVLQVYLLLFAQRRRQNIGAITRTLLWLAYLLADSTALYILGHMSISSSKSSEHQQLMALWGPCLLVHLGGQDTITAYSMEDSRLWTRHLVSLVVQVMGVAYVIFQYRARSSTSLVTAAMMMFVAGVVKYGERVWALGSSSLNDLSWFLNRTENCRVLEARRAEGEPYSPHVKRVEGVELGSEEVLQGAHDLFPICLGQFVGYKFWPSRLQSKAIKLFHDKGRMYELIEMQLSLIYDILYTKAAVIHTRRGCLLRAVSMVCTITAFFLFQSTANSGKIHFERVDVIVTYILLAGALLLEITTMLVAMGSTWTCALFRGRRWDRLHSIALSLRRLIRAAEISRSWSGFIGQHKFLDLSDRIGQESRAGGYIFGGIGELCGWKCPTKISERTKELVLEEILRMVKACKGREEIMRTYNGQCALQPFFEDLTSITSITGSYFDQKVLIWHSATEIFISSSSSVQAGKHHAVVKAIRELSSYMMWLLVERPYMLPSPVRPAFYAKTESKFVELGSCGVKVLLELGKDVLESRAPPSLVRGEQLARILLNKEDTVPEVPQVVLGVWVEMLCYAAHRCSRDSHARQLNSGIELISIVWLLTGAMFNSIYCDEPWFIEGAQKFLKPPRHQEDIPNPDA